MQITVAQTLFELNKGNGTDGVIHSRVAPQAYEECRRISGTNDFHFLVCSTH